MTTFQQYFSFLFFFILLDATLCNQSKVRVYSVIAMTVNVFTQLVTKEYLNFETPNS